MLGFSSLMCMDLSELIIFVLADNVLQEFVVVHSEKSYNKETAIIAKGYLESTIFVKKKEFHFVYQDGYRKS